MEFPSRFKGKINILYIYNVKLIYYLNVQSYSSLKIYDLQKDMSLDCTDELKVLVYGPLNAYSYTMYIVKGVQFVMGSHALWRTTQNSGFVTLGENNTPFYG